MDVALITGGLGLLGYLINKQDEKYNISDFGNDSSDDDGIKVKKYNKSENDIYINKVVRQLNRPYDRKKYKLHNDSLKPNTNLVNGVWRILNDKEKNKKIKKSVEDTVNKDLNNLKNIKHNNIEPMSNMKNNYPTDDLDYSDDDSVFSDNYEYNNYINPNNSGNNKRKNKQKQADRHRARMINKINNNDSYISEDGTNSYDNSTYENSSYETEPNINMKVLNTQEQFMDDIATSLSGEFEKEQQTDYSCNEQSELDRQFDQLRFDHKGLPGTIPQDRKLLKPFNERMKVISESEFDPEDDGRYGVTGDMSHNNMVPFFKSATYGYNPSRDQQMGNYSTRQIELFTGSDQDPNFKHKKELEREQMFPNEVNKTVPVTGMPNFSDYFESRYIPSQTRNGEKPVQPIRDTPGLNLGYNQVGAGNDLYRALPKNVDQLRTINNPKVSYEQPIIPGQKGEKRRVMGKQVQQGPDRFYYNSPDSMLPQVGEFEAPAMYGKYIIDPTNREMNGGNDYVGPAASQVQKSTPEYLQGQFKNPFKKT